MAASSEADPTGGVLAELLSPAGLADPYAVYRRLREEREAGRDLGRLVIGHADALAVLGDRTLSSDRVTTTLKPLDPAERASLDPAERASLDPLERTLRAIVEPELTYQPTLDFRGPTSLRVRGEQARFATGS